MTQEDKDLLLKDLCARLPYGVICYYVDPLGTIHNNVTLDVKEATDALACNFAECKPYLRPMSSMTEEEEKEYAKLWELQAEYCTDADIRYKVELFDFLNSYHFDYRGLIEKNLAIDCTGMHIYD